MLKPIKVDLSLNTPNLGALTCVKIRELIPRYNRLESFEFLPYVFTPAKAGVQKVLKRLDTGFRRYDDLPNFKSNSKLSTNRFYTYNHRLWMNLIARHWTTGKKNTLFLTGFVLLWTLSDYLLVDEVYQTTHPSLRFIYAYHNLFFMDTPKSTPQK
jgi:hypothetical protein